MWEMNRLGGSSRQHRRQGLTSEPDSRSVGPSSTSDKASHKPRRQSCHVPARQTAATCPCLAQTYRNDPPPHAFSSLFVTPCIQPAPRRFFTLMSGLVSSSWLMPIALLSPRLFMMKGMLVPAGRRVGAHSNGGSWHGRQSLWQRSRRASWLMLPSAGCMHGRLQEQLSTGAPTSRRAPFPLPGAPLSHTTSRGHIRRCTIGTGWAFRRHKVTRGAAKHSRHVAHGQYPRPAPRHLPAPTKGYTPPSPHVFVLLLDLLPAALEYDLRL